MQLISRTKDVNRISSSLTSLDKIRGSDRKEVLSITEPFAEQRSPRGKKSTSKNIPLKSQFRRKSCHCSECGGISKLELRVQDIVSAPSRNIRITQIIRQKNRKKTMRRKGSIHLNLPTLGTLFASKKERRKS